MNKPYIKNSIDKLNPTEEQSQRMWERLSSTISENNKENTTMNIMTMNQKTNRAFRRVLTTAASIAAITIAGLAVNHATGGAISNTIKEVLGINQGRQDVIGNIQETQERTTSVYAPEIYYTDENIVIFGELRGLVIYDLKKEKVAGVIDVQDIDCVYFNSDEKETRIVKSEDKLILFNAEKNHPTGEYYIYDLSDCDGKKLPLNEKGDDKQQLTTYNNMWKTVDASYQHTFDLCQGNPKLEKLIHDDSHEVFVKYSERSFTWTDDAGNTCHRFFANKEDAFTLYTYDSTDNSITNVTLDLNTYDASNDDSASEVILNKFVYTGDNLAIKAICEYMETKYMNNYASEGQISIPGYVIYKEVEVDDEYLVFGNFWSYGYQLTGNVLEAASGGEMPACFHLKKTANGYNVVSVDIAGDGDDYVKGIKAFTKSYPELYDMFMEKDNDQRIQAMQEYLQMYVTDNNLDIEYFKEYGWDSIRIFN